MWKYMSPLYLSKYLWWIIQRRGPGTCCIVHSNRPCCWWILLGERCCFRGWRGLASPECAGLSSPPDMVAQDSSSLGHKDPLHILLYPNHCVRPASGHTTPLPASGLKASPVTGWTQCQFSCWKCSGAKVSDHLYCTSYTHATWGVAAHKQEESTFRKI